MTRVGENRTVVRDAVDSSNFECGRTDRKDHARLLRLAVWRYFEWVKGGWGVTDPVWVGAVEAEECDGVREQAKKIFDAEPVAEWEWRYGCDGRCLERGAATD